ncbi:hypothetical protein [Leeuwenhoekiella marinoflava]|uniref:Uncharacterized protein n=2 Tax=Leeuwenhoekiella marinoflava TaxID=988 RepID=A0A4Q0PNL1_9FLAO|nr:hypothetical protein [Leeuwenhoekiella marinoflava]RXG32031.1 hypothetical protein DSL99_1336 [Leeuwenhoekiella marinoflava]SHE95563.1 hypothetical protein SAMN02745246_01391 [Leeuwenhoekiella marinoflava DSM 3653]
MSINLAAKATQTPFICGLYYSKGDKSYAAVGSKGFTDTILLEEAYQDVYASLSAIRFSQKSTPSRSGDSFAQQLQFQFPNGDKEMAARITEIKRAKYMILKLTNNEFMIIGRNDLEQNTRPTITSENNTRTTQITFEAQSIFPAGRFNDVSGKLLPALIPLSLL